MDKPIVHYRDVVTPVCVGHSAVVWPIDHPSDLVSNGGIPCRTSPVITCTPGERGPLFETRNTYYKPAGDTPLPVRAEAEFIGFGAFMESLGTRPEVVH